MAQEYATREELEELKDLVEALVRTVLRLLSIAEKQEAAVEELRNDLRELRIEISEKLGAVEGKLEVKIEEAKDEGVAQIKQEIRAAKKDVLTALHRPSSNY